MSLTVHIPDTFNGPLDLLLYLIRRDEMDIEDINIATLASSYLEEMHKLDMVNVDEAAEFLDLASKLLEIKSRMLAPDETGPEEEGEAEDDFDPRSDLVAALLEYRKFKDAAKMLGELAEEQARRFPRIAPRFEFAPAEDAPVANSLDLMLAFQNLLVRMVPADDSNTITYTEVPTQVRIEQIETVLGQLETTRFSKLLSGAPSRREMVGFFIAILELVRLGKVVARQSDNFSDIILERRVAEPPKAERVPRRCHRPTCCFLDLARETREFPDRPVPRGPFPCSAPLRHVRPLPPKRRLSGIFP